MCRRVVNQICQILQTEFQNSNMFKLVCQTLSNDEASIYPEVGKKYVYKIINQMWHFYKRCSAFRRNGCQLLR